VRQATVVALDNGCICEGGVGFPDLLILAQNYGSTALTGAGKSLAAGADSLAKRGRAARRR
jgi:hypothetical protein